MTKSVFALTPNPEWIVLFYGSQVAAGRDCAFHINRLCSSNRDLTVLSAYAGYLARAVWTFLDISAV